MHAKEQKIKKVYFSSYDRLKLCNVRAERYIVSIYFIKYEAISKAEMANQKAKLGEVAVVAVGNSEMRI